VLAPRHALGGLLAALCALALVACGGDSEDGGTFDQSDFPFTFEYPDGFQVTDDVTINRQLGNGADAQAAVALDDDDLIILQSFTLKAEINESNLDVIQKELTRLLDQVDPGTTLKPTRVAGLLGLTGELSTVPDVEDGHSTLTFFFDGDQEYEINCQSTPDHRDDVDAACTQALDTLKLK
jgi:hypothetical protein